MGAVAATAAGLAAVNMGGMGAVAATMVGLAAVE